MRNFSIQLFILVVLLLVVNTRGSWQQPCVSYGCPHQPHYEPFVPAPPGHTPRCAKPGQTFCESLDHYPQQLIKFLVEKCSYDFATILRDESQYDFNAHTPKPEYNHDGYNYPRPEVAQFYPQPVAFLSPQYPFASQSPVVYNPPSNDTAAREGYTYSSPDRTTKNPFLLEVTEKYRPVSSTNFHGNIGGVINHESNWLTNRNINHYNNAPAQSTRENPLLQFANRNFKKRQVNPQAIPLCRTNAQYIMPKAALNNRGNWMYVVNLPQSADNYSQLVKSELCAVTTCNGLCSLPEGYQSRCEQQYVQKRLVALEGSGSRLYTDVFWFPNGCSCQIIPNF